MVIFLAVGFFCSILFGGFLFAFYFVLFVHLGAFWFGFYLGGVFFWLVGFLFFVTALH